MGDRGVGADIAPVVDQDGRCDGGDYTNIEPACERT